MRFKSFKCGCALLLHSEVIVLGFFPNRAASSFWLMPLITKTSLIRFIPFKSNQQTSVMYFVQGKYAEVFLSVTT